jgi:HNH endonuclease
LKVIELTQGQVAIVDDEDFEWLAQWRWNYYKERTNGGYAHRSAQRINGRRPHLLMHREIMSPIPNGMEVDHINGNKLDNRRCNLRYATPQQNRHNRTRYSNSTTGLKGVTFNKKNKKKPFQSHICDRWKKIHLGYFSTPEEAATAYNNAAIRLHGSFARLN